MEYKDFINDILNKMPKFKENMKLEVLSSIYPDEETIKNNSHLKENFTKPLALSVKDKLKIRKKENDILKDFLNYKKTKKEKGDILIVKKIENNIAFCENITRPNEINEKYFNGEEIKYIKLTSKDILEGNVKIIKRIRN